MRRSTGFLAAVGAAFVLLAGSASAANMVQLTVINGTPCIGDGSVRCFNLGETIEAELRINFTNFTGGALLEFVFPRQLAAYQSWQFGLDFPQNNEAACDPTAADYDDCLAENLHFSEGPESDYIRESPHSRTRALVGDFDPFRGEQLLGLLKLTAQAAGDGSVLPQPEVEFQTSSGNSLVVSYSGDSFRIIPEPGTLLLVGAGLLGLAATRRPRA